MLDVGSKSFTPQGETGNCGFLLNCTLLCQEWGLWQACVSAFLPISMWVFLFTQCAGVIRGNSFREDSFMCSCRFGVSVGGGVFSILWGCRHVGQNSPSFYFFMGKKGIEMFCVWLHVTGQTTALFFSFIEVSGNRQSRLVPLLFHVIIILGCFYVSAPAILGVWFSSLRLHRQVQHPHSKQEEGRVEPQRGISGEFPWENKSHNPRVSSASLARTVICYPQL